MIELRPYTSLGGFDHGWLNTKHHFSFGSYADPARMGWGALRVVNDDIIAPNSGFPPHPHRDMEIITVVMQGAISHKDSLGHAGRTAAQEVQVMTAGTGVLHEEWNQEDEVTQLYQIWIQPKSLGLRPRWASRSLATHLEVDSFVTLACGDAPSEHVLPLHADASIRRAKLNKGAEVHHTPAPSRRIYVLLASGELAVNSVIMHAGDGLAVKDESQLHFVAHEASEVLLIDVAE